MLSLVKAAPDNKTVINKSGSGFICSINLLDLSNTTGTTSPVTMLNYIE